MRRQIINLNLKNMSFELPKLPYAYDALEPHIDARTMEIHHSKHHQAYITNLNAAIAGTDLEGKSIEEILIKGANIPAVRNNGGGYWNHNLFWEVMAPNKGGEPTGALAEDINATFGSVENFKAEFAKAGVTRFGSGWAWLSLVNGKLEVSSTPNQDNQLMQEGFNGTPLLAMDVWEHAYYLHYQNRRPDYITAFFNVINWDVVAERYNAAKK